MAKIASHRFEDYTCVHKLYMDSCGIGQQSNNTFIDCLTFFSLFFLLKRYQNSAVRGNYLLRGGGWNA